MAVDRPCLTEDDQWIDPDRTPLTLPCKEGRCSMAESVNQFAFEAVFGRDQSQPWSRIQANRQASELDVKLELINSTPF